MSKVKESIEMHFRCMILRLFNHTILRINSFVLQISAWVLSSFECPCLFHQFWARIFLHLETQVRHVQQKDFLHTHLRNNMLSVHLIQIDFHKRFPACHMGHNCVTTGKTTNSLQKRSSARPFLGTWPCHKYENVCDCLHSTLSV